MLTVIDISMLVLAVAGAIFMVRSTRALHRKIEESIERDQARLDALPCARNSGELN
jgi:hypothetical protein